MRLIQFFQNSKSSSGFTVVELLVAMGLSSIVVALISGTLIAQSDYYMEDVARTRIQQNLRGALDILSMNIRQAGEGLDGTFPAVLLIDGESGEPDELLLRRNLVSDVLLVCQPVVAGANRIYISDSTSTSTECLPSNVADAIERWKSYRSAATESVAAYIYDRVSKVGEFVTYADEGKSGGNDYITITDLSNEYPSGSTSVYILEEYEFLLDQVDNSLQVNLDGRTFEPEDVAYDITGFQVQLDLEDGTTITSLLEDSAVNWHAIRKIRVELTGLEVWKKRSFERSVTGEYFPRNVMSK